jgi:hypothetical protein
MAGLHGLPSFIRLRGCFLIRIYLSCVIVACMDDLLQINSVVFKNNKAYVDLFVPEQYGRTSQIRSTTKRILEEIPGLQFHKCFNSQDTSFIEEVTDTETAHFFEHLLLEIIGMKDLSAQEVIGWTTWDWKKFPRWTFQIEVEYQNPSVLLVSVAESLNLINTHLISDKVLVQSVG